MNVNRKISVTSSALKIHIDFIQLIFITLLLTASLTTVTMRKTPLTNITDFFYKNTSLPTPEMLRLSGYEVECHSITTADGYVLEVHRIPKSKSGKLAFKNHPVYLHHGVLTSSADWIIAGADNSIATQLADQGYDVWLGNSRGNTYSRKHVSLNPKSKEYWNFGLEEIGIFDLPAVIDYILSTSGKEKIHYLGFSMGTTLFYIMASERPEYQLKIRSQISLAPVAYLSNIKSTLKYIAPHARELKFLAKFISNGAFMPETDTWKFLAGTMCREPFLQKKICAKILIFSVCGTDLHQFNMSLIPLIFGHSPAGTSIKLMEHYAQIIMSEGFRKFDYGPTQNMKVYNCTTPPSYKLESIKVPMSIMYGENDILADPADVLKLKERLPNIINFIKIDNPWFNHVDFLWSKGVNFYVNDRVITLFNESDDLSWNISTYLTSSQSPTGKTNDVNTLSSCDFSKESIVNDSGDFNIKNRPSLDFLKTHLDEIISKGMPHIEKTLSQAENYEKELQKTFISNLLDLEKSYRKKSNELLNNMDTHVTMADRVVKDNVAKSFSVIDRNVKIVSKTLNNNILMIEKTIEKNIIKTENIISDSFTNANHFMQNETDRLSRTVRNALQKVFRFI
ncbi:lipase 3-like [Daktulosphaira vitifoliae]|uniref:lipase 3-like n=1 Tax=Daktulosphaira vitifoliae TaxID=58002 RepID=UPI0021AAAAA3|nr:lipase 3-like [Daktulosphaira vitifoliae]